MKKSQVLAAFAFALALGVAMPVFTAPTYAATMSETALAGSLANTNNSTIVLDGDVLLTAPLTISRDVTIDLNGYKITAASGQRILNVVEGNVVIKNGTLVANGTTAINVSGQSVKTDIRTTNLTLASDLKLDASGRMGIIVSKASPYNITINIEGEIKALLGVYVNGEVVDRTNYPTINIKDGAKITASDTLIGGNGYAKWNIGAATMVSDRDGVLVKSGEFIFTNTDITTKGPLGVGADPDTGAPTPYGDGMHGQSGAVIRIEDYATVYAGNATVSIHGGNYVSENSVVFYEYANSNTEGDDALKALDINGGVFRGATGVFSGVDTEDVEILNGSFSADIKGYVGEGTTLIKTTYPNGTVAWIAATANTTPSTPNDTDKPGEDQNKPGNDLTTPPTGALLDGENSASTTVAMVAGIATALTAAGAGVVAYRNARRSSRK